MQRSPVRVLLMVLGGLIAGYAGYWIGHLAGWSTDADWSLRIGGGTGAILLSIGMTVAGAALPGLLRTGRRRHSPVLARRGRGGTLRRRGAGLHRPAPGAGPVGRAVTARLRGR
jgi:hypothetical protein